ncbi:hypothetical protein RhiXN_04946 [Rhizoctonia solani]|uniref:Uncharacterized protein n=1 Tax=Rhizoctonia solani TaxID=456999 RepID=A0A8H8SSU8_9AGAM|nr:uncharacterized protein RhiXN_04946 [Rhizoctonia solani]QRW16944.1 hypothetical protein RhiXN_04946 [Rhizoctonia solani]
MSNGDKPRSSLLELQDPQTRTSRVEDYLNQRPPVQNQQSVFLQGARRIAQYCLPINNDLLNRLEAFLPAMHESTQRLQQQVQSDPTSLDIEHLDPSAQEYIEMASLGVYESRPVESHTSSSEEDSDSGSSSSSDSDSDSGSDSDSDSGPDSDDGRPDVLSILMRAVPPVPRAQPLATRPNIVMLQSSSPEPQQESRTS